MESEGYSSAQNENSGRQETVAHLKRKRSKKGKRFNDEQIRSLESIFKVETKLEAKKKIQLARDLGLQPRQIAIWFQNRRARWKSKQIEEEYKGLKASFDSLSMEFESLKKERESLLIQLERLSNLVGSPKDGHSRSRDSEDHNGISNGGTEEEGDKNDHEFNEEPISNLSHQGLLNHQHQNMVITNSSNEEQRQDQTESFKFSDGYAAAGESCSLASPEEWCSVDLGGLFTQSCASSSKWWEF